MYDETITLEDQGIKYNLIDPREYGVNFKGQCYFATVETIEEAPDLLTAALRALVQGWELAARSPAQAISALKEKSPTLNSASEEKRLIRALPFFVPDDRQKILRTDPASWSGMIASMVSSDVLKQPIAAADVLQMNLLDQAYAAIDG
jgi:ABC-type nitrate/sulfonate/bicarbonate transport system substrate-binding protein